MTACPMCEQETHGAAHARAIDCLDALNNRAKLAVNRWMDTQASRLAAAFAEADSNENQEAQP